jgi:hypothetical protein
MRIMEQLGFFSALGVVVVFIAAAAFGRIMSVPGGIAAIEEPVTETVPAETVPVRTAMVPVSQTQASDLPSRRFLRRGAPAETVPAQDANAGNTQTIG